jgi:23S rRNA G2069 N7-methylase RlmK/C1962 C5-methylase RlmI
MAKQPTATAFTRTQESWARFVLDKIEKKIEERESWLYENGWREEDLDKDPELIDLYDDELFYERYADEMEKQREYIRENYL